MVISIRFATNEDLESVSLLFERTVTPLTYYNQLAKQHELAKYTIELLCDKILEDPKSVIVAIANDEIVGFCFNRVDDFTIWIEWFGVCDNARRSGIGKALVAFLEESASDREVHKVWCDCRTGNIKSINLLTTSGYTPICTIKNHWYKQDFILWQKDIT
jgi:ribosomal protein S18 acetylase RimI-like enzyme